MTEAEIQAAIQRDLGRGETRIFRNHVGQGWTGELVKSDDGVVVLRNARPARFGLADGSHDLIGIRRLLITPEMVGGHIGAFLSVEVKSPTGRTSASQDRWTNMVRAFGGLAGAARSVDQARLIARLDP
ncbi:VRR-NUC domain-containing protein [Roseomonas xinghualingensis]|uniref:VRR-NUC domain-containing protein n=1 Tax=Roseomonas xinghualingensis TaxID=2986475 RepID=UPI0021F1FAB0|nr:VRR-NUC domain-containing protein [Roseomonas sp. SXEYE001]MCV4209969.1 VRR-NUC domain-containing protein [Roseomonas sp. SXEYE001]